MLKYSFISAAHSTYMLSLYSSFWLKLERTLFHTYSTFISVLSLLSVDIGGQKNVSTLIDSFWRARLNPNSSGIWLHSWLFAPVPCSDRIFLVNVHTGFLEISLYCKCSSSQWMHLVRTVLHSACPNVLVQLHPKPFPHFYFYETIKLMKKKFVLHVLCFSLLVFSSVSSLQVTSFSNP